MIDVPVRLGGLLILAQLLLSGCATPAGSAPSSTTPEFQRGETRLECRLTCAFSWGASRDKAKSLHDQERWTELVALVSLIGFDQDLPYYYLGRAAEALGHVEAARRYYRIGGESQISCSSVINTCDGFDIKRTIFGRLSALDAPKAQTVAVPSKSPENSVSPQSETPQLPSVSTPPPAQPASVSATAASSAQVSRSAPSQTDRRTPIERYQGAYTGARVLCAATHILSQKVEEAQARQIEVKPETRERANLSKCLSEQLATLKTEYQSFSRSLGKRDSQKALTDHYVSAVLAVKGISPYIGESQSSYRERQQSNQRKTEEMWVLFELTL